MSNGVNFRKLALDLRDQLDSALAREAGLRGELERQISRSNDFASKLSGAQQRLTVQDQRVDELVELLTAAQNAMPWVSNSELWERIYTALKPTAEAEPQCLLCLDKKTVPGNIPGGFVKDCCGEEG